jgi:hypothetical protein
MFFLFNSPSQEGIVGNINKQTLKEILYSKKYNEIINSPERGLFNECNYCIRHDYY